MVHGLAEDKCLGAEQHESLIDDEERQGPTQDGAQQTFEEGFHARPSLTEGAESAVDREEQAMQEAPDGEVPAGAMPQAAQRHGDEKVPAGIPVRSAAAAQGNEQVI